MHVAERVSLGESPVSVTRLGLGLAPIGGLFAPVSDDQAVDTIDRSWELGLRFFDTAPLYGYGRSEERAGKALHTKPRADYVLATKVGRRLEAGGVDTQEVWFDVPDVAPVFDFSYDGTMRSYEESLERLGLDRIDVLHIHDPDDHYDAAVAGAYRALEDLRGQGAVGAISVGMNQAGMLARFVQDTDIDCVLLAGRYTLLDQSSLTELLPLCNESGVAVIAGGVYNSGVLADPTQSGTYNYAPAPQEILLRARRLDEVCARHGVPLKAAAIQFPLGHPAVACVVIGARSPSEIEENVRLSEISIPGELWEDLKAERLLTPEVPIPNANPR